MQLDCVIHQTLGMPGHNYYCYTGGYFNSHRYSMMRSVSNWRSHLSGLEIGALIPAEKHQHQSGKMLSSLIWTVVKECHCQQVHCKHYSQEHPSNSRVQL